MMRPHRSRHLVCGIAATLAGCAAGSDVGIDSVGGRDVDRGSIEDRDDLAIARAIWMSEQPDGYRAVVEGKVAGVGVSEWITVDGGRLTEPGERLGADATIDGMYDQIATALDAGNSVDATYDRATGVVLNLRIDRPGNDDVRLVLQDYDGVDRLVGCDVPSGAITDLTVEPISYQLYDTLNRFVDAAGCPVRLDLLSAFPGAEHCNWESVTFLGVDESISDQIEAHAGVFIHDPDRKLEAFDDVDRSARVAVGQLPPTAIDTGFELDAGSQRGVLWADKVHPDALYLVEGDQAARFVRDVGDKIGCA